MKKARQRLTAINTAIAEAKRFLNFAEKAKENLESELKRMSRQKENSYFIGYYRDNKFAQTKRSAFDLRQILAKITNEYSQGK